MMGKKPKKDQAVDRNSPIKVGSTVQSSGEVHIYPGSHGVMQIATRQRLVKLVN